MLMVNRLLHALSPTDIPSCIWSVPGNALKCPLSTCTNLLGGFLKAWHRYLAIKYHSIVTFTDRIIIDSPNQELTWKLWEYVMPHKFGEGTSVWVYKFQVSSCVSSHSCIHMSTSIFNLWWKMAKWVAQLAKQVYISISLRRLSVNWTKEAYKQYGKHLWSAFLIDGICTQGDKHKHWQSSIGQIVY